MRKHTFAATETHVLVGVPGFCGSLQDYMMARTCQLRALCALMVSASATMGELNDNLRADLLWLSQSLSDEIAEAVGQFGVNEPANEVAHDA